MATDNENKINDLLEDLELQKFIHDDLVETRSHDIEAITEALDMIRKLETEVAQLLGQEAPVAPTPYAPAPAPAAGATPGSSRQPTPSIPQPHRPSNIPKSSFHPPAQGLRTDPLSTAYWPSSAPSPFAALSQRQPEFSLSVPPDGSRKRPRQDSGGSQAQPQSSKRAVLDRSRSRMAEIDAELETQLVENKDMYDDLQDPESVRITALAEGISEDQVRENIEKEREETERLIREEFQMERDEELARMLQAQEEPSEDERDFTPQQPFNRLPALDPRQMCSLQPPFNSRTVFDPRPTFRLPDRTYYSPPPPGTFSLPPFDFSHSPPRPFSFNPAANDDDLQEITPDYFHSRVGAPPRFGPPPRFELPRMIPRTLPWMSDLRDPNTMGKAMDLVREQVDLDVDEDDLVYVFSFLDRMYRGWKLT